MKKFILALTAILFTIVSFSQENESKNSGGLRRGGGGNPRMKEALKQRLITDLKLSPEQADSVSVIQFNHQKSAREIKQNTELSEDDKKSKMKQLIVERNAKLKSILNEDQIIKLQEMMEEMKNRRQENGEGKKD